MNFVAVSTCHFDICLLYTSVDGKGILQRFLDICGDYFGNEIYSDTTKLLEIQDQDRQGIRPGAEIYAHGNRHHHHHDQGAHHPDPAVQMDLVLIGFIHRFFHDNPSSAPKTRRQQIRRQNIRIQDGAGHGSQHTDRQSEVFKPLDLPDLDKDPADPHEKSRREQRQDRKQAVGNPHAQEGRDHAQKQGRDKKIAPLCVPFLQLMDAALDLLQKQGDNDERRDAAQRHDPSHSREGRRVGDRIRDALALSLIHI